MQTASVSVIRQRLASGGPSAIATLVPENPSGASPAEAIEADAYESIGAGRPGAAFLALREASLAWRDAAAETDADECDAAAVALFQSAFPPHRDAYDGWRDHADWLIARLELERLTIEARAELRPGPTLDARLDVEERRHRWFCRMLAARNAGLVTPLDRFCAEARLDARDLDWLAALYTTSRDHAVWRVAARLPGEDPPRLTAGLLATCLAGGPSDVGATLARLAPTRALHTLGAITVQAPWPEAPLGLARVSLPELVASLLDGRA